MSKKGITLATDSNPSTSKSTNIIPIRIEKLLLIDGSNMLSRAYYATSKSGNMMQISDGRYTNAVYSMVQGFFNLLKNHRLSKVCILWDKSRNTWRREIYPLYKANRSETDPKLKEQFETTQWLFDKMGVPQMASEKYEADDFIGSLATKFLNDHHEGEVVIVSSDQDLFQLLNERTYQIAFHKGKEIRFTVDNFKEKYGVNPDQWVDVKAILGDKSDNIPGVTGCGEKAALPLISKFGSLDGVFEDLGKLEPEFKRYVKKLKEGKEDAFLSKRLATIVTDIEGIVNSWSDFHIKMSKKGTFEAFRELEFDSLLEKIS